MSELPLQVGDEVFLVGRGWTHAFLVGPQPQTVAKERTMGRRRHVQIDGKWYAEDGSDIKSPYNGPRWRRMTKELKEELAEADLERQFKRLRDLIGGARYSNEHQAAIPLMRRLVTMLGLNKDTTK